MRPLPNDISRCVNHDCEVNDTCARYQQFLMDKGHEMGRFVYTPFNGGQDCEFHIPINSITNKDNG